MSRYSIQGPPYPFAILPLTGADSGFEIGGRGDLGQDFLAYFGQFMGLFNEIGTKRGGRAPPLWIRP